MPEWKKHWEGKYMPPDCRRDVDYIKNDARNPHLISGKSQKSACGLPGIYPELIRLPETDKALCVEASDMGCARDQRDIVPLPREFVSPAVWRGEPR